MTRRYWLATLVAVVGFIDAAAEIPMGVFPVRRGSDRLHLTLSPCGFYHGLLLRRGGRHRAGPA
ncbi:MAG: hypothetical protein HY702_05970 [Gemmatimonadetes bacterium]|nr:hypothetical protein [Gemmatimonadota bacterium]